ncbi:DUF5134 domain-containing protein [Streptomyces hoynatensis]|uniref:DUF5134 domain-containing protein n=1 Tax=Streptomyces hoynatensis TaxID=1141874 RepID=A0A3A9YRF6_9ACTN|nr:DUF5134 domain-containing protein [Streptomyces hoynatensis]RKN38560.1 DUF5134 domain-containing protein [Streptomyces hoynatensis]
MHGPVLVGWLLVALCGGTGGYCLTRVRGGRPRERRAAAAEAAMGLGMAVMALPTGQPGGFPGDLVLLCVAVLSGGTALGAAAVLGFGAAHRAHHVVETAAMLYMALAMGAAPAAAHHAAHQPGGNPLLTGVLLAYFGGYALCAGPRLLPAAVGGGHGGPAGGAGGAPERPPELAAACRLALAVGMFAMLLTM